MYNVANCHSERHKNELIDSYDLLKDVIILYPRIDTAKNLDPNCLKGASLDKLVDRLWGDHSPWEEILRCGRHRRNVKPVLARVDPVKKGYRFPLRMTAEVIVFRSG